MPADRETTKEATPEELDAAGFHNVAHALREGAIVSATILFDTDVGIVPVPAPEWIDLPEALRNEWQNAR